MQTKRKVIRKKSKIAIVNMRMLIMILILGALVTLVVTNVLFTMVTGVHFRSGQTIVSEDAEKGLIKSTVYAERGNIFDRNREIIAQNIDSYNLIVILDQDRKYGNEIAHVAVDKMEETAEALAPILECEAENLLQYMTSAIETNPDVYQTELGNYGKELSAQQKADIEALDLPGLEFEETVSRVYPVSHFASQLIGYAQYNEEDGRISGVNGLEQYYDEYLKGIDGEIIYKNDGNGTLIPNSTVQTKSAENGSDVYLTIDKNVQLAVEEALNDTMTSNDATAAWCIVMEADTGKVLAQAGYPSFDLNERDEITQHLNIPAQYTFEPGSVLKPFIYAAAMNEGVYDENVLYSTNPVALGYDINGNLAEVYANSSNHIRTIGNAEGKTYGNITFDEGLIRSTNTTTVHLVMDYLTPELAVDYLKRFNLDEPVEMEGIHLAAGVMNVTNPLDLYSAIFGQSITVNSYQLIRAASALFTDGRMVEPYIVEKIVNPNTDEVEYQAEEKKSEQVISEEAAQQIQDLMTEVVELDYGTANSYQMSDVTLMGKTGTGEIAVEGGYSSEIFTSSMLAAAPADNPEIIIYYAFQSSNIKTYNREYFQDIVREALMAVDMYNEVNEQTTNESDANTIYSVYTMPELVNHTFSYIESKLNPHTQNIHYIGDGTSIIAQFPSANEEVVSTQKVFLLTNGTSISMPDMSGWNRTDVTVFCDMVGLQLSIEGDGSVQSQSIQAGSSIQEGQTLVTVLKNEEQLAAEAQEKEKEETP